MDRNTAIRDRVRHRWLPLVRLVAFCAAVAVSGCNDEPARQGVSSPPTARYDLTGKIVSVDKAAKQLTVDHEAIPGFMSAMTMPYPVRDEQALDGLSPGDQVTAKVVGGNGSYWLEEIAVTKLGSKPGANQ